MVDVGYPRRGGSRRATARTRARPRRSLGPFVAALTLLILAAVLGQTSLVQDALNRISDAFGPGVAVGTDSTPVPATVFALCGSRGHADCVIDGDTFYLGTQSIRVADIDAPETHPPRCAYEEQLGDQATLRLMSLLNAGPFELTLYDSRDVDQYGRKLRVVLRDGRSLGDQLVAEGLARNWTGSRQPWCA